MSKNMKPEDIVAMRVANYLKMEYPNLPFRIDMVDSVGRANGIKFKALHGKWSRGYPDLFVPAPIGEFHGLYLELKATKTLPNDKHTREQKAFHRVLRKLGYKCKFCLGFEDCKSKINKYFNL